MKLLLNSCKNTLVINVFFVRFMVNGQEIYPSTRYTLYEDLSDADILAAAELGYDEFTWNVPGNANIEYFSWESIGNTAPIAELDMNEDIWDCYVNHYEDYDWSEIVESGKDASFRALGWTESSWENFQAPPSDDLDWEELTEAEKLAAQDLCYLPETWDGLDMALWVDPKSTGIANVIANVIRGFVLVNTDTNSDIRSLQNGDVLDVASLESRVSIRVDVVDDTETTEIDSVEFDFASVVRRDGRPPFLLGGDNGLGNYYAVNRLLDVGRHDVAVTVFGTTEGSSEIVILEQQAIALQTINSTESDTLSPTATPLDTYDVEPYNLVGDHLNGELKQWHKITLGFAGRPNTESNAVRNPFLNFRMTVNFRHSATNKEYVVPGYYACDGDAANTGESSGVAWLVHFTPDEVGEWTYRVSYVTGINVAVDETAASESAGFFDGDTGSFIVEPTDKSGRDLRGKGLLRYVRKHHLQFAGTGEYFLKAGPGSPENLLAYDDFDDTPNTDNLRKGYEAHLRDYVEGDTTWMQGKGKGLIGAINYLSSKGMNSISFLTMNINGDDKNVFPYQDVNNFKLMDCSKLAQWEVIFEHADKMGMHLHFKLQEEENDLLLDGGELGIDRKLYYRELVARFGHHLALSWNLGKENSNTPQQRKAFIDYIKQLDPYDHPIVAHSSFARANQEEVFAPLLGDSNFDGVSLNTNTTDVFDDSLFWIARSAERNHPWIVTSGEQSDAQVGVLSDRDDPFKDAIRIDILWANIAAGGAGVEYYFGTGIEDADLIVENFRSRDLMFDFSRHALDFFYDNKIPFWDMSNANEVLRNNANTNAMCLAQSNGESIVIYFKRFFPQEALATIDLSRWSAKAYTVEWFDPRNGGSLQEGSVPSIKVVIGSSSNIGTPPGDGGDWVALLRATVSNSCIGLNQMCFGNDVCCGGYICSANMCTRPRIRIDDGDKDDMRLSNGSRTRGGITGGPRKQRILKGQ